jgi:hypothetical protein
MALIVLALIAALCIVASFLLARDLWSTPMAPYMVLHRVWIGGLLDGLTIFAIVLIVVLWIAR